MAKKKTLKNDDIDEKKRLELYNSQYLIRVAEQRAYDLFLENLVKGTSHLSLGQEAIAAGFATAMQENDKSFCTYRGHAHTLARGASVVGVLGELMQRDCGLMRGKGGSMHMFSKKHNFRKTLFNEIIIRNDNGQNKIVLLYLFFGRSLRKLFYILFRL